MNYCDFIGINPYTSIQQIQINQIWVYCNQNFTLSKILTLLNKYILVSSLSLLSTAAMLVLIIGKFKKMWPDRICLYEDHSVENQHHLSL